MVSEMRVFLTLLATLILTGCPTKDRLYPYDTCMTVDAYSSRGGQKIAGMITIPVTMKGKGIFQPKLCDPSLPCGTLIGSNTNTREIKEAPACWNWTVHQRMKDEPYWNVGPEMENIMQYVKESGACVKVCEITEIRSAWLSEPAKTISRTNVPVWGEMREWGCKAGSCVCNGEVR